MPADTKAAMTSAWPAPPSSLTAWQAGFLENSAGALDRLGSAEVKSGKRHIDHHQGMADRPAHDLGMIDHLVQRHRQRGGATLHDHRKRVAHQDALDPRGIHQLRGRVVIGGQHRDLLAGRLHGGELRNGDGRRVGGHGRWGDVQIGWGVLLVRSGLTGSCRAEKGVWFGGVPSQGFPARFPILIRNGHP